MTIELRMLIDLLGADRDLVDELVDEGMLRPGADVFHDEEVETILVARTLRRELDVNPPGVEIILRLRRELLDTQRQVAQLAELLRRGDTER